MKTTLSLAASALLALSLATTGAFAQDSKGAKDSIAGKAGTATAAKATKSGKPVAQATTAPAVKASPAPALSKPAATAEAEGALGRAKDETKSHCHSRGSDA